MDFLEEIYLTYLWFLNSLEKAKEDDAPAYDVGWERMSELNQYAYFILLFGQIEDFVDREYEEFHGSGDDSAFIHRVNVLFDQDSEQAELIREYYKLRCDIAHGRAETGQLGTEIHIPGVYEEIWNIVNS